jgi:MFS family permease
MLAGQRDLRLVLSAGIISRTGDWILTIGLIYQVYAATGSTVASALAMASAFAPQVLLGAVAGVFADRWDLAAQAVGGIVGGMVVAASGRRFRASRMTCYGAVAFGLVDLAIFLYPLGYAAVWPAVAGMIVVGVPGALTLAGLITLFQRSSEDAYRGRVFGAVSALGITVLAGTLGAGYLSRLAGIIPVLAVQGGGYMVAGLAMLAWLKEAPGEPASTGAKARRQGEPALVAADG